MERPRSAPPKGGAPSLTHTRVPTVPEADMTVETKATTSYTNEFDIHTPSDSQHADHEAGETCVQPPSRSAFEELPPSSRVKRRIRSAPPRNARSSGSRSSPCSSPRCSPRSPRTSPRSPRTRSSLSIQLRSQVSERDRTCRQGADDSSSSPRRQQHTSSTAPSNPMRWFRALRLLSSGAKPPEREESKNEQHDAPSDKSERSTAAPASPLDVHAELPGPLSAASEQEDECNYDPAQDVEDWLQMVEQVQREETQRKSMVWNFDFEREVPYEERASSSIRWERVHGIP